jgi:transposase
VRIFLCVEPVDMRLGFDRLARIARERLGRDPVDGGALFVFGARGGTRLKVLWFDRNGLCVLYKRFHQARFQLPKASSGQGVLHIDAATLGALLSGVPHSTPHWRRKEQAPRVNA